MLYLERFPHVKKLLFSLGWTRQGNKLIHPLVKY